MSRSSRRGPWLPEEDNALVDLVRTQGPNNWVRISQQLQYRSPKQCRERYHQNLKPSLNHEPISAQEGDMIEQLVNDMGKRWAEIARRLGNRSDNAVKNWWNGSMNRRKRNPSHGHAPKQIGNRQYPVHCGKDFRISHEAPSYGPSLSRTPHMQLPYSSPDSACRRKPAEILNLPPPQPQPEHVIHRPSAYAQPSPTERYFAPYQPYNVAQKPDYFLHSYHNSQTSSLPSLRLPPISNRNSETHIEAERPSVSPAASDFAHSLYSRQPPSLISDNQSTCSISPKTLISPRLNGQAYWLPYDGTETCDTSVQPVPKYYSNYNDNRDTQPYPYCQNPHGNSERPRPSGVLVQQSSTKDCRMNVASLLK